MTMYCRKAEYIHAEPYKEGMEDGFIDKFKLFNNNKGLESCLESLVPYICMNHNQTAIIPEGGYIVTNLDGSKYPVSAKSLHNNYIKTDHRILNIFEIRDEIGVLRLYDNLMKKVEDLRGLKIRITVEEIS